MEVELGEDLKHQLHLYFKQWAMWCPGLPDAGGKVGKVDCEKSHKDNDVPTSLSLKQGL